MVKPIELLTLHKPTIQPHPAVLFGGLLVCGAIGYFSAKWFEGDFWAFVSHSMRMALGIRVAELIAS